jgi:protoheme IX farnesyltransferase
VVAVTLTLLWFRAMGPVYVVAALVLGAAFIVRAAQLARETTPARAMQLFAFSNTYLALLFAAIAVDTLLRAT